VQRVVRPARAIRGALTVPGNKSVSHRAAIFNAIAAGAQTGDRPVDAVIRDFQRSEDTLATLRCLRLLGADWRWRNETTLVVRGVGRHGLHEPDRVLDCRNSGTTMRLLAGLLAGQPFFSVLTGDRSLRSRPMDRIVTPLRRMGADIRGRDGDTRAPVSVRGKRLKGIDYRSPVASAQVKGAVLLAALYAEGETTFEEPALSRDHSERMLRAMGASVRSRGSTVLLRPLRRDLRPLSLRVPGDISAAAPWIVLAACHRDAELRLRGVGVNPTRTGVLDALALMGADVRLSRPRDWGPEPVADITVRSSRLRGAEIAGDLVPRAVDELPLLALAACFARGETLIRDAAELRVKESDRIRATVRGLRALGADVQELPDGLRVRPTRRRLRGAAVSSLGDHRLAMTFAVAGLLARGSTVVRNAGAVAVSYPLFWRDLDSVSGR